MSLGEVMVKPTTMLYRNFLAMETEELLRSHPVDGVVLMGGCDKTTPALLMGAFSMNLPAIFVPAGAMLNGYFKGRKIGTGTHTRKYWDERRAGKLSDSDWVRLESDMTRSHGTCNTMGTASTMTALAEMLGMSLSGSATVPASDSAHPRLCSAAGERVVAMVWEDLKPSDVVTQNSLENAVIAYAALGGSTNAAIHLKAMAERLGLELSLDHLDEWSRRIPVIANLMPSGEYLMEDWYRAGGLPALAGELREHLHLDARTVSGYSLGEHLDRAEVYDSDVIRRLDDPVSTLGTLAVLRGNLCPDGAVIKPSAASEELMVHRGKALVFDDHASMSARIDDPDLAIDKDTVLVLRNAGPQGGPGMPEWGGLPIPKKLLREGVRDMVRISDARMSGTHFGTCVLHVAPESFVGGPLALVQDGDYIELDVPARTLELCVSAEELRQRKEKWRPPAAKYERGYGAMYSRHVTQANEGCDFDFLRGNQPVPEPEIF